MRPVLVCFARKAARVPNAFISGLLDERFSRNAHYQFFELSRIVQSFRHHWPLLLALIAWPLLMLFCHERHVASDDPGNFVLMLRHGYDLAQMRPHAPGYP